MRIKQSPFSKVNINPVLVYENGNVKVFFGSKGAIDPNTSPISLQEKQKKQAEISILVFEAAENLAKAKKGITPESAREMFFSPASRPTVKDYLSDSTKTTFEEIIEAAAEKMAEMEGISVEQALSILDPKPSGVQENILDYLNSDQKQRYFSLASESQDLPLKVATLMIRHRILYGVTLKEPAKAKSKQILIEEPWFDLNIGDRLRFGNITVKVTEVYDPEYGHLGVEPLPNNLEAGVTGFLLKDNSTSMVMGDPNWTEEDTRNLSIETATGEDSQIDAIYRFYLKESGRLSEEVTEGKLPPSKNNVENSGDLLAVIP